VKRLLAKAKGICEAGGDWEHKNKLKVGPGRGRGFAASGMLKSGNSGACGASAAAKRPAAAGRPASNGASGSA
jgi:hypothetical protein